MFYCRETEIYNLYKGYYNKDFECIVVYDRCRVGKTALTNEFCQGKLAKFFSVLNASSQENLEVLSKTIYEKVHPVVEAAPVWENGAKLNL